MRSLQPVIIRCFLGISALVLAPALAPAQHLPDLYMVSVGIDRYQPPTNNLSGCIGDAQGMASVF